MHRDSGSRIPLLVQAWLSGCLENDDNCNYASYFQVWRSHRPKLSQVRTLTIRNRNALKPQTFTKRARRPETMPQMDHRLMLGRWSCWTCFEDIRWSSKYFTHQSKFNAYMYISAFACICILSADFIFRPKHTNKDGKAMKPTETPTITGENPNEEKPQRSETTDSQKDDPIRGKYTEILDQECNC